METDALYRQRLTRILKAAALEEPDRVPVVLEYSGFAAYATGTKMADFLGSPEGELALAQACVYLATAPKSNAVYTAYKSALRAAKEFGSLLPPRT